MKPPRPRDPTTILRIQVTSLPTNDISLTFRVWRPQRSRIARPSSSRGSHVTRIETTVPGTRGAAWPVQARPRHPCRVLLELRRVRRHGCLVGDPTVGIDRLDTSARGPAAQDLSLYLVGFLGAAMTRVLLPQGAQHPSCARALRPCLSACAPLSGHGFERDGRVKHP